MRVHEKYRGYAVLDFNSYLECRQNIADGFHVEHFTRLKGYYRRAFLNQPFRKGF